jgi:ABC-2 type transport system permease protein
MGRIWCIAAKDLRLLMRDKAGLFWVLVFPLLIAILFGSIFGSDSANASKMKIGMDDADGSDSSRSFAAKLAESSAVQIKTEGFGAAQNEVRKGSLVAAIQIPKGFGSESAFSGRQPSLLVAIDPARKAEKGFLKGIIAEASFAPIQDMFSNPAKAKAEMSRSMQQIEGSTSLSQAEKQNLGQFLSDATRYFSSPSTNAKSGGISGPNLKEVSVSPDQAGPASAYEITFPQGIIWGLVAVAMSFAVGTVKERVSGTYARLRIAPLTRTQYLLGKALACFIGCAGIICLLFAVGVAVFHVAIHQPAILAAAVASASLCFVGITMLISVASKSEEAASGAGRAALLLFSTFGGAMIPQIVMPPWMLSAASFSPVKWAILAFEGATWRGFTWAEMMVPCGILMAIALGCFGVGSMILSRTRD